MKRLKLAFAGTYYKADEVDAEIEVLRAERREETQRRTTLEGDKAELMEEIEALREELARYTAAEANDPKAWAEIEALKKENAMLKDAALGTPCEQIRHAEQVEALKKEIRFQKNRAEYWKSISDPQKAEIEALKAQLDFYSIKCNKCGSHLGLLAECPLCEARAEIEALKETVDRARQHRDFALNKGYEYKKDAERWRKARDIGYMQWHGGGIQVLRNKHADAAIEAAMEGEK